MLTLLESSLFNLINKITSLYFIMFYGILAIPNFYNFADFLIRNNNEDALITALSIFNVILAILSALLVCIFDFNYHLTPEDRYARRD